MQSRFTDIEIAIDEKIGEVRIDGLDMTFGEIFSLIGSKEFEIGPDFQRLFRWSTEQRSRLVESILIGLPIPQIFTIETETGVLELIDGLQRICSVAHFLQPELIAIKEPLILQGCDLLEELNGKSAEELPLVLRLRLKRTPVRMVVVKRQSTSMLRYSMFKRLNTGGSELSAQEIRNCTSRMVGTSGSDFYDFLRSCSQDPDFLTCTETISSSDKDKKADEELVLRFFALKNGQRLFRGNVRDWLDDYMEEVILGKQEFDYNLEREVFQTLFSYISRELGVHAFVKHRGSNPIGGLAPAYFEAVTMAVLRNLPDLQDLSQGIVKGAVVSAVQSEEFRGNVGPGANKQSKLDGRILVVHNAIQAVCR
jgi:hypothetical protein